MQCDKLLRYSFDCCRLLESPNKVSHVQACNQKKREKKLTEAADSALDVSCPRCKDAAFRLREV